MRLEGASLDCTNQPAVAKLALADGPGTEFALILMEVGSDGFGKFEASPISLVDECSHLNELI